MEDISTVTSQIVWNSDQTYLAIAVNYIRGGEVEGHVLIVQDANKQVIARIPIRWWPSLAWNPSTPILYIDHVDELHAFDVSTNSIQRVLHLQSLVASDETTGVQAMSVHPNGNMLAALLTQWAGKQSLHILGTQTFEVLTHLDILDKSSSRNTMEWIGFNQNGGRLAAINWRSDVYIWNTEDWSLEHELNAGRGRDRLYAGAWNGDTIAVADIRGLVDVWSALDGSLRHSIPTGISIVRNNICWHPDGRQLAVNGYVDKVSRGTRIYDMQTGNAIREITHPSASISSMGFQHDGTLHYGLEYRKQEIAAESFEQLTTHLLKAEFIPFLD